ncbi:DUF411 domain-containing protein [Vreelandella titanicae]|uniref:Metal-binding protein n=1 Tax=Vreelandella titanicae BH1 TaxID=1204738 RepID=L9U6J9_9GAMM|nr:DUF411 domain-containing protein [Halomonas titanicae]ELY20505.1 Protein of unknown function DUF411 [Halomonas titanicae BH1]MBR9903563.1 DUF411 domain-containing protein [Gammaproteobacteria bacterium]
MKHWKALAVTSLLAFPVSGLAADISATLYKNPNCGCCAEYAKYLEQNGFDVETIDTHDLVEMKAEYNVPEELHGCHTTVVRDYLFEGHVPVESVTQVLDEKPSIIGLSVPGMPLGSPGMSGEKRGPLEVYAIASQPTDSPDIYATH